ncbi:MAG: hypothetical protein H5T59_01035 [Anaerolineae bacterium]|nr:hypothetical protein [Anaerolineae bacterium]
MRPALALGLALLLGEAALGLWLARQPLGLPAFATGVAGIVGLALSGAVGWWLWSYWSLRYHLDRNGLVIRWAGLRQTIPLEAILAVERGAEGPMRRRALHPLRRAGYWVGPLPTGSGERVQAFATRPPAEHLLLRTEAGSWAITPRDPEAFLHRLEAEKGLGPTRRLALAREWLGPWGWSLWRDRWAWALWAAGLLGALALWGLVAAHPKALGLPPLAGPGAAVGFLALTWAWGAWVHRRSRRRAYLLWGGAAWVQWAGALLVWAGAMR